MDLGEGRGGAGRCMIMSDWFREETTGLYNIRGAVDAKWLERSALGEPRL